MGQQQQQPPRVDLEGAWGSFSSPDDLAVIYDPAQKKFVTAAELNQPQGRPGDVGPQQPFARLGLNGPGGEFAGVTLPPVSGDNAEQILDAVPQLGGMLAQVIPQLRSAKASFMIPAVVEAIVEKLHGEDFDVDRIVGQGALGVGAHGVGAGLTGVAGLGKNLVKKSLNLNGTQWANRAGEEMLPKLALREGAEMTKEGVDRIASKANATGSGGLQDLAEALERARLGDSLAPVGGGGGVFALVRDMFSPPLQLATGKALAQPGGVSTANTIAPSAEAATRAFFAWLSSQLPGNQQLEQTRRRPLVP